MKRNLDSGSRKAFAADGGSKPKEVTPVIMQRLSSERMSVRNLAKAAADDDALTTEIRR